MRAHFWPFTPNLLETVQITSAWWKPWWKTIFYTRLVQFVHFTPGRWIADFLQKNKTKNMLVLFYMFILVCVWQIQLKSILVVFKKNNSLVSFWVIVLSKRNSAMITPAWWKMYKLPKPDGKCRISTRAGGNTSDWCAQLKFCKIFIVYSSAILFIARYVYEIPFVTVFHSTHNVKIFYSGPE